MNGSATAAKVQLGSPARIRVIAFAVAVFASACAHDPALEAARGHFRRGCELYDLARYGEAIREFEFAYRIKDDPVLLYNIAQAHRLSGDSKSALRMYKTYLRRAPRASNVDEVQQRIRTLESPPTVPARAEPPPNLSI